MPGIPSCRYINKHVEILKCTQYARLPSGDGYIFGEYIKALRKLGLCPSLR